MRPIDADSLKKTLKDIECVGGHEYWRAGTQAMIDKMFPQIIDDTPTIEVKQVEHGRWKVAKSSEGLPTNRFVCSECMGLVQISVYCYHCMFNYCPNCGARMDGENT